MPLSSKLIADYIELINSKLDVIPISHVNYFVLVINVLDYICYREVILDELRARIHDATLDNLDFEKELFDSLHAIVMILKYPEDYVEHCSNYNEYQDLIVARIQSKKTELSLLTPEQKVAYVQNISSHHNLNIEQQQILSAHNARRELSIAIHPLLLEARANIVGWIQILMETSLSNNQDLSSKILNLEAILSNDKATITCFLNSQKRINLSDSEACFPYMSEIKILFRAIFEDDVQVMNFILFYNTEDWHNFLGAQFIKLELILSLATQLNRINIVKYLLSRENINYDYSIEAQDIPRCVRVIISDLFDEYGGGSLHLGYTPLMLAVDNKSLALATLLLSKSCVNLHQVYPDTRLSIFTASLAKDCLDISRNLITHPRFEIDREDPRHVRFFNQVTEEPARSSFCIIG